MEIIRKYRDQSSLRTKDLRGDTFQTDATRDASIGLLQIIIVI